MRVPVGIDPQETWSVDFCAEAKRLEVELLARAAERVGDGAERKGIDAVRETAAAELAKYTPGSGPVFTLGHVPAVKRAEIFGMAEEARHLTKDRERAAAEHTWRREVVRWAVRGHTNLRTAGGAEVPFEAEEVRVAGEVYRVPTERQIERYTPFLGQLADVCLDPQRLGGVEKNA